jgi:phage repressor protein C with HTH and peptisase S24 domain
MDTKQTARTTSDGAVPAVAEQVQPLKIEEASPAYFAPAVDRADARTKARVAFMRDFGLRCKAARGSKEISDLALRVGVHRNTLWNIERGDSLPDAFMLELLAKEYETTTSELLGGESKKQESTTSRVPKSTQAVQVGEVVYVPIFDIRASAGSGAFNDIEAVTAMRPFDASFIRYDLGISHNDIVISSVVGRSMEPWLHHKDTTLTDLRDREALTEGVHLVRLDGAMLVKKLQRLPGKVLRVSSYNPDYEPFDIRGTEDAERDFEVIGRVRWGGVTFN